MAQAVVNVANVNPSVGAVSGPIVPVAINTPANLSVAFSDPGVLDTHTAVWDWDDGTTSAATVSEANGGFVTGGGWINSPAGAYAPDPALTGKANFGFVSKYQKGTSVPAGNTQFQLQAAGFSFESTSYEWLVISGAKAQFKGAGTINGTGAYAFLLTASDGERMGSSDRFRIKIWDKGTGSVVFDNQVNASDTAEPTTALGGTEYCRQEEPARLWAGSSSKANSSGIGRHGQHRYDLCRRRDGRSVDHDPMRLL